MSGNKKKIAKNVFWAMLGKIVNMAGTLFVGILVARYLGPENYGLMNYVFSYVALFHVLASFGLSNIEIRELSRYPEKREVILGTSFRIRVFFAFLAYLLIVISLIIHNADRFTSLMILVYAFSLFTNCFEIIRNYFTSIVLNEYIVKSEIARTAIGSIIKISLLFLKLPVEFFIIATLFDTVLVSSGYIVSYHKFVGNLSRWKLDKKMIPFFIMEAFPLLLSGSAVIIYQRIDQVMIGNIIDKSSVGYFATAGKFLSLILFLPTVLTQTVTPLVIRTKKNGTKEEYEKKQRQLVGIVVWVAILLATVVSLSAYWLILYTYGMQYMLAVPVLQIMAWKTVGMALSSSAGQIIIMEGIQKWAVLKNLLGCAVCVILNYFLLPVYGIVGSAWITIITTLIAGFIGNILIPAYHHIFKLQLYSILFGWRELKYFKSFVKR